MPDPNAPDTPEQVFTYTVHPFRHDRGRGGVALVLVLASAWGAAVTLGSLLAGAAALAVLGLGLARFFFPTAYSLDADGISVRTWCTRSRRRWQEFQRFRDHGDAVVLLTRRRASRLDAHRSLTLPYGAEGQAVLARVRAAVPLQAPHAPGGRAVEARAGS